MTSLSQETYTTNLLASRNQIENAMRMKAIIIPVLSLAVLASITMLANANPIPIWDQPIPGGILKPDSFTQPPTMAYLSNVTAFNSSNISLPVEIKVGDSISAKSKQLDLIYYKGDWQDNITELYRYLPAFMNGSRPRMSSIEEYCATINLTAIPEGNHTLTVNAGEIGSYIRHQNNRYYAYSFVINETSTIDFSIDTISPTISALSIENSTYYSSELPLSFNVDDKNPRLQYCIDNQSNITLTSNTTLNGLTEGTHRITIYAMDSFDNISSQTITFTVIQQSPIMIEGVCALILAVGISLVLLLFRRHRKTAMSRKLDE